MIEIIINGNPVPKKRPRFARRGNFVMTYSDQGKIEQKQKAIIQGQVKEPLPGPLSVSCLFCMERPRSHYGTGKNAGQVKAGASRFHTVKPDTDNLIKWALDCLNGIAFADDKQVVEITGRKEYSSVPRTEITVREVEHDFSF